MIKNINFKNRTFFVAIIVILTIVGGLYSTYAINVYMEKTTSTNYDMALNFDVSNTLNNQMTVAAGKSKIFDIDVTNNNSGSIKYGVVYQMVSPTTKPSTVTVAQYIDSKDSATGLVNAKTKKTITVIIKNDSSSTVKVSFSVVSGFINGGALPIPSGMYLLEEKYDPVYGSGMLVTSEVLELYTEDNRSEGNLEFSYTGSVQSTTLSPGTYKLEVWGAQGGYRSSATYGGKGGYSYGTLTLTDETTAFIYVGGSGNTGGSSGGFNGGGRRVDMPGGGGASDVRLGTDSLYARVIVAGGGGSDGATNKKGMYGGGIAGGSSTESYGTGGYGGTQTGVSNSSWLSSSTTTEVWYDEIYAYAGFGFGGNGVSNDQYDEEAGEYYDTSYAGAGGGGWYGGSGSVPDGSGDDDRGGGGGSGYVYTSSTASSYPSGCLLNPSLYLTNAETIAGNQSFTDFNGSTVTGRSGNGAARISWQFGDIKYFIPRVIGLEDITIVPGETTDLTTGVTYECETGSTSCTYEGPENVDLSTLPAGEHTINYVIIGSNGRRYLYPRKVIVEGLTSSQVLVNLGLTVSSGNPDFSKTSCSSGCGESTVGVFAAEDDLGTSYYFRGDVTNNYVRFGKNSSGNDMYWRIIRINGDGTVRMIYDGTQAHDNGTISTDRRAGTSKFNSSYYDNTFVGYMYGGTGQSTFELTHSNKYDSTIKTYLEGTSANNYTDGWYYKNIVATGYNDYVADAIYCNDRSLSSGTGIGLTSNTVYGSNARIKSTGSKPTLKCDLDNNTTKRDSFSVNEGLGNGLLNYPVGLITLDEVNYAGMVSGTVANKILYLYTGHSYWTMTPDAAVSEYAVRVRVVSGDGRMDTVYLLDGAGVRPVISLKSTAIKSGNGTKGNPFSVEEVTLTSAQVLANLGLSVSSGTPNLAVSSCSSGFGCKESTVGIYEAEDDLGTSYYFRGDVTNNYVKFGKNSSGNDMYWRIIRINGDGTVRMIYDGTQAYDNGTASEERAVGTSRFNPEYMDNTYAGYMYGDTGQSTFALTHSNKYNSTIKTYLEGTSANNYQDGWYYKNIVATGYNDYVADAIYCNDRSLESGTGLGSNTSTTNYGAHGRVETNKTPTLKCDLDNNTTKRDSFTVKEGLGNGLLKYPVGLITIDEVLYGGGSINWNNEKYYLYTGNYYWTISPVYYMDEYNGLWGYRVCDTGSIGTVRVIQGMYVRPVISLKPDVLQYNASTSNGTKEYPFILKTS